MADEATVILGDQRQRQIACGAQPLDDRHLAAVAMRHAGECKRGDPCDCRLVAARFLANPLRRRGWPH